MQDKHTTSGLITHSQLITIRKMNANNEVIQ